jgi:very-short-patch-repair endonuclease/DNA polymerase III delta prime subunit
MDKETQESTIQSRFKGLFEFLKAYNDLRTPVISDISQQIATLWLDSIPKHPSIKLSEYTANVKKEFEEDGHQENDVVLEVTRPIMTPCPKPPEILSDWLIPGWTKIYNKAEVRESRNIAKKDETEIEGFDDIGERKKAFEVWIKKRNVWADNEKFTWEAVKFFERIYELYGQMEREGERIELLLGEGILECSDESLGIFRHPVLLQRLELEFHPEKKQPQFILRRREQPPELCLEFLRVLPNLDTQQLVRCTDELKNMEFDPLGQEDTTGFLRRLIQGLFPNGGQYIENVSQKFPENVTIERNPVIFMRQRRAGLGHAMDLILQDITNRINTGEDFSIAMMQILGINHENIILSEEENDVSKFGNEDTEILLSKPANQEQLQIAKQLEHRGTVLVQGPPGTGKTHTIANLIGHLLSQGKRVLVTAQTPKALRVLREQIVPEIQSLCVSVLHKEKQNIEELKRSVQDINVQLSQNEGRLEKITAQTQEERSQIIDELCKLRQKLFDAREDEIREIVFGGKGIRPIEAAKKVKERMNTDDWIPGPVTLGAGLPLTHSEISTLYQTNIISVADEKEINTERFDLGELPSVTDFTNLVKDLSKAREQDINFGKEYWNEDVKSMEPAELEDLIASATKAIKFFKESSPWRMEAVQAGRDGEVSKKSWVSLMEFIDQSWKEIQESNILIMEHGPTTTDSRPVHITLPIINEIVSFVESGNSLGVLARMTKRPWFQFLKTIQIGGKPIHLKKKEQLFAVQAYLKVHSLRQELCARWERRMVPGGAPDIPELGDKPEQICRQFIPNIRDSLDWHSKVWLPLESELNRLGFNWPVYFDTTKPEVGENAELLRLRTSVLGDFGKILRSKLSALRLLRLEDKLSLYQTQIPKETKKDGRLTRELRQSLVDVDPQLYAQSYKELNRLKILEQDIRLRNSLLEKMAIHAPAWASAIQIRLFKHGQIQPPGNPESAWEWRQLQDELERRASVSLEDLQEHIENLNGQLLEVTSTLVEKRTWLNQIRTVDPKERQALSAYATLQSKKTKGGKGKMDESIRAAARREMEAAKGAVPVWIMPLNEVVENFNPMNTRFDVVIIDEASQSDPLSMFALYLGKQAVVVGDDEQVTPTAPGIESDEIMKLIRTYLHDIPYKEFYDGQTSIYAFAQTVFGNVIRLVEHFRCAPDIIAFSNALSYGGEIKPLREERSILLHPNVVSHRVNGVVADDKTNKVEAEATAALICAAIEQPEYNKKTFGVVSLLGDQQASEVEKILTVKIPADEYHQRDIICGNPAHFQGDQRDVMFLTMVDSPTGGPLNLRDGDANRKLFKKRYNVAASRAKDQMWLVHSLNHETDLKSGDIRKRLIEHMLDPKAWQRERDNLITKAESPFEEKVISRLLEHGFKVQPQYEVGAYRIDMVVSGTVKRVGIECDGEQWHGPDKLQEDMERQAILERLGWKFIRIRGSVFFRDADRAMESVFNRLADLGILPDRQDSIIIDTKSSDLVERVRCRAQELQEEWRAQLEIEDVIL